MKEEGVLGERKDEGGEGEMREEGEQDSGGGGRGVTEFA